MVMVALESLKRNPKNPRKHPPKQIEAMAESIQAFGQQRSVLARKANRMLIAGHGVWLACQMAGLEEIDVNFWDVDQRTADLFMIGDNRTAELGSTDQTKIRSLIKELEPDNYLALGYNATDVRTLLGEVKDDDLAPVEIVNASDVEDVFWISIRGPLKQQAATLKAIQNSTKRIKDIHVELGTREEFLV